MSRQNPEDVIVGITMGDPSGIGPEVIVQAHERIRQHVVPVVIGDEPVLEAAIDVCEADVGLQRIDTPAEATAVDRSVLPLLDLANVSDHRWGVVDAAFGRASLAYVERAIELALEGAIDAIVTAPINKQATRAAGSEHAGHTGLLAARTNTERYSMMLIAHGLRVTHVSTHVPLREACALVETDRVVETIHVTHGALRELGIDAPTIAVAGLNPHAGDDRLLGTEDADEIAPAVAQVRDAEIDAVGPISPDTVYVRAAAGEFDCVVSMYHDQGHIPIKMLGFSAGEAVSGVNVTIGLPIVRTSVDHGTAFDIAGQGVADATSMVDAVEVAARLVGVRRGGSDR